MRIDLHPGSDLAANVQHDLVAFLEAGFDLHDIPVVYADLDVPKLYHILSSMIATWVLVGTTMPPPEPGRRWDS